MHLLAYYLWFAPHALVLLLLALLFYRGFQAEFPLFTFYLGFDIVRFFGSLYLGLRVPSGSLSAYRWLILVVGGSGDIALQLAVIYELTAKLLKRGRSPIRALQRTMCGFGLVLLLAAVISSDGLSRISAQTALNVFESLDFASSVVIAVLLLTLFFLIRVLAISWPQRLVGIALGLGISTSVDLVGAALKAAYRTAALRPVDILDLSAFHISVIVWLIYFLPRPRRGIPTNGHLEHADLQLWGEQMQRMVN